MVRSFPLVFSCSSSNNILSRCEEEGVSKRKWCAGKTLSVCLVILFCLFISHISSPYFSLSSACVFLIHLCLLCNILTSLKLNKEKVLTEVQIHYDLFHVDSFHLLFFLTFIRFKSITFELYFNFINDKAHIYLSFEMEVTFNNILSHIIAWLYTHWVRICRWMRSAYHRMYFLYFSYGKKNLVSSFCVDLNTTSFTFVITFDCVWKACPSDFL